MTDPDAGYLSAKRSVLPTILLYLLCAVSAGALCGAVFAVRSGHLPAEKPAQEAQAPAASPAATAAPAAVPAVVPASPVSAPTVAPVPLKRVSAPARKQTKALRTRGRRRARTRRAAKTHLARAERASVAVVAAKPAYASPLPAALPVPMPESPAVGFKMQGDLTVVDYDRKRRVIFTQEGAMLSLAMMGLGGAESPVGGIPEHLHYTCNQQNDCTLSAPGEDALHGRLVRPLP